MYRHHASAPESRLPAERRGPVVGRFCHACRSIFPALAAAHVGKPAYGRDHVAAPCVHEGRRFEPDEEWWEPAVELLPESSAA